MVDPSDVAVNGKQRIAIRLSDIHLDTLALRAGCHSYSIRIMLETDEVYTMHGLYIHNSTQYVLITLTALIGQLPLVAAKSPNTCNHPRDYHTLGPIGRPAELNFCES